MLAGWGDPPDNERFRSIKAELEALRPETSGRDLAVITHALIMAAWMEGDIPAVRRLASEARSAGVLFDAAYHEAEAARLQGDFDDAERLHCEYHGRAAEAGVRWDEFTTVIHLSEIAATRGDFNEARSLAERWASEFDDLAETPWYKDR